MTCSWSFIYNQNHVKDEYGNDNNDIRINANVDNIKVLMYQYQKIIKVTLLMIRKITHDENYRIAGGYNNLVEL